MHTRTPRKFIGQTACKTSEYADLKNDDTITTTELDVQDRVDGNDQINTPLIELCNSDSIMDLCGIDNNVNIGSSLDAPSCNDDNLTDQKQQTNLLGHNLLSSKISMALKLKKKQMDPANNFQPDNSPFAKGLKQKSWIELFADLDPLANLEAFDLKINGNLKSSQQT
ncbi:uncharacterized protein [Musca autumnalis]|uniref:uncharacterized protein n=1 Tax=Musca autumnalis TaxID=221902 RepID=UPI003CF52351